MLRRFALVIAAGATLVIGVVLTPTEASAWRYRCWGCGPYYYYGWYRPYYVPVYAGYYGYGWRRPYYAGYYGYGWRRPYYAGYYGYGWRRPVYAWGWRPRVVAFGW
jgi:hypothetical protein